MTRQSAYISSKAFIIEYKTDFMTSKVATSYLLCVAPYCSHNKQKKMLSVSQVPSYGIFSVCLTIS